jgi:hypothetical protein
MNLWDFLRPVTTKAWEVNLILEPFAMLLSIGILAVSVLAYRKTQSKRLLLVSAAFFFFALKWTLRVVDQIVSPGFFFSRASEAVVEVVILGLLFFAIFKK